MNVTIRKGVRLKQIFLLASLVFSLALSTLCDAADGTAAPIRIAIVTQPNLSRDAEARARQTVVKGFLLTRFERIAGLRVLDPERVDSLCAHFATSAYDIDGKRVFQHLSTFLALDVLIYLEANEGRTSLQIFPNNAPAKREINFDVPADLWKELKAASDFLCSELKVTAVAAEGPDASAKPDYIRTYYFLMGRAPFFVPTEDRLVRAASVQDPSRESVTPGLAFIVPFWSAHRESAPIAARMLYSTLLLRPVPVTPFSEKQCDDIAGAIRAVLGTAMEPTAYPLLSVPTSPVVEAALQKMSRPLLPGQRDAAAVDEIFDKAMESGGSKIDIDRTAPVKDPGAAASKSTSLGALRALGCIATPTALATLVSATKSDDGAVREAAAVGLGRQINDTAKKTLRTLADDAQASVSLAAMTSLSRQGVVAPKLLAALRNLPDSAFAGSVANCTAFATAATAEDAPRLALLSTSVSGAGRVAIVRERLRLQSLPLAEAVALLKDDDGNVVLEVLRAKSVAAAPEAAATIRALANDPNAELASAAYESLLAQVKQGGPDERLLRLDGGTQYERLSVLTGIECKRDIVPDLELLKKAVENYVPVVRFEALRLINERHPEAAASAVRTALNDSHRWVRLQAATIAADRAMPELAEPLKIALAREVSPFIQEALRIASARAAGTPLPPPRLAAIPAGDSRRRVWSTSPTDKDLDYTPIEGIICKNYSSIKALRDHGKPVFGRLLWGLLPHGDAMLRSPRAFDELWSNVDGPPDDTQDGFDFRNDFGATDWATSWRDFCRDAHIDPARINGDVTKLSVYEKRAFEVWAHEVTISGFNLIGDLLRLKTRFLRPNMQVSYWGPRGWEDDFNAPLDRWKFDMNWSISTADERMWSNYTRARMARTLWPGRSHLYDTPVPGGLPDFWIRFNSPMPKSFIFKSENDIFTHTALAWLAGAHLTLVGWWDFVDYKTPAKGPYPPGIGVSITTIGPSPQPMEKGIELAFKDAPLEGRPKVGVETPTDNSVDLVATSDAVAPAKQAIRVGLRLAQKHLYDCARIFASLPRHEPKCDTLVIQAGVMPLSASVPTGAAPVNAGRELISEFDFLPGINLVVGRDLRPYKLIIVHNATLLQDETIRALTAWLRETRGVLLIHQDLTADNTAEASTVADHDGLLKEDWPWEKDLVIHPADAKAKFVRSDFEVAFGAEKATVSADANMSTIDCLTPKATSIAKVGSKTVLACWRDPAFRGVVYFDGLRSPSKPYADRIATEMNTLAKTGVGRFVGGAVIKDVETEFFRVVANPHYGESLKSARKVTGIDLMSGVVDPVVGPDSPSAIVPVNDYFNRYLACTRTIVALGELEFKQASKTNDGMLLQNAGVIQLAARSKLQITRKDGGALPVIPFDFEWFFNGKKEGVATYETPIGSKLTFVRCAEPVVVKETP